MKFSTQQIQRFFLLGEKSVAANFLANPAGSTITQANGCVVVATQTGAGGVGGASASSAFVSQNTDAANATFWRYAA